MNSNCLPRATGITTRIGEVTRDQSIFTIADYTDFLDIPAPVSGAILLSTAPCDIEEMMFSANTSIREVDIGTHIQIYTLLKMGRYYNTTMCHYWDMLVK